MFQRISTVLVPAPSYDLTDLATAKDELSVKPNDSTTDKFLARAISQASSAISDYCARVFQIETVRDVIKNTAGEQFCLERRPVALIKYFEVEGLQLLEGIDFDIDAETAVINFRREREHLHSFRRDHTVRVEYVSGCTSPGASTAMVPATGPYTITVPNAASFVKSVSVTGSDGTEFCPVSSDPAQGQYSVNAGVYSFNAGDASANVQILYRFAAIPFAIIDATLRLVTMQFRRRGRDPLLMSSSSQSVGEQRWWVGGTASQNSSPFPPEIEGLLDPYKIPAVG